MHPAPVYWQFVLNFLPGLLHASWKIQGAPDNLLGCSTGIIQWAVMCGLWIVCRGTSLGLTYTEGHYNQYRARYTNCTYVDGNLELVFLVNASYDMSFLRHIREVTGYVLIIACYMDYIPLNSLQVIRGRTLYEHNGRYYSLYVALNYDETTEGVGLKELRLTSLHGEFVHILTQHSSFHSISFMHSSSHGITFVQIMSPAQDKPLI